MIATIEELCIAVVDCEHKTTSIDESGDYFAVGTPAMRGNVIDYSQARRISRETFDAWTRRLKPKFGDLLLAREAPVGPVVLIPETENVAPGQRTVLMRPDPSVADSRFLYYLLSSPKQQKLLQTKAAGSTVAHLNVAEVRTFPLELPSVNEQRAIAEVLGALDDKIAANVRASDTVSALAETHFRNLMTAAIKEVTLGNILTLEYGKPLPAPSREAGIVPVYGSGGIVGLHNQSLVGGPGVIVGRKGTAGAVHWSPVPHFAIDTTYFVIPKDPKRWAHFCYFVLKSLKLNEQNSDSAVPGLNRNDAYSMKLQLPDDDKMRAFNELVKPLFDLSAQLAAENYTLAATRDALLPQLMSGKLRVRDAEKTVEAVM